MTDPYHEEVRIARAEQHRRRRMALLPYARRVKEKAAPEALLMMADGASYYLASIVCAKRHGVHIDDLQKVVNDMRFKEDL